MGAQVRERASQRERDRAREMHKWIRSGNTQHAGTNTRAHTRVHNEIFVVFLLSGCQNKREPIQTLLARRLLGNENAIRGAAGIVPCLPSCFEPGCYVCVCKEARWEGVREDWREGGREERMESSCWLLDV